MPNSAASSAADSGCAYRAGFRRLKAQRWRAAEVALEIGQTLARPLEVAG